METTSDRVRIVLADDHALFREGVKEILKCEPGWDVVGEAGDGPQCIETVVAHRPDVVLLDVQMGDSSVMDTVRTLRSTSPESRIIILSMHDDAELLRQLLAFGISGYLIKNANRSELVSAIRASLDRPNHVVVSVSLRAFGGPCADRLAKPLSARELQVLALVSQALSNAGIARQLFLTEATVKRHLRNIFAKLDAASRIDAVNKAVGAGLLMSNAPATGANAFGPS